MTNLVFLTIIDVRNVSKTRKGVFPLEMAKVTSKGQITIPVSIRRKLGINEGDKLLFIDRPDGVLVVNPNMLHMERFDELPAEQASGLDEQLSGALSDIATPDEKYSYNSQSKSESKNRPSSGFDVTALLNDIRSMGSKV